MGASISKQKGICIHGHFYQPPRENPWTGEVEDQPGAAPFHDWNARITAECYAPNTVARILNSDGDVADVVNNYSKISFNFGPTLLNWLEEYQSRTYEFIQAADQASLENFSGHGSALAQSYHHSILPLANRRDKETEIYWGLRDFEHRFGRFPEGMWLPEAAVDLETLDLLKRSGVCFVILSPFQAARVRRSGASKWQTVGKGKLDTRKPYRIELPSGGEISVFFYDGSISQQVAFGGILSNGEKFGLRLLEQVDSDNSAQLVTAATDGETYGHHHRFGEMALAYALKTIEEDPRAVLSIYGEFLERHPPTDHARIIENSSWSCVHGIERWQRDCGCHTGGEEGWNQRWRKPLRSSLNWLRDSLAPQYEMHTSELLTEPWSARNAYINLLLNPRLEERQRFFEKWSRRPLNRQEESQALELLELQRYALMMFTSCGWFFNDLAGIETIQILRYAARAIELAQDLFGEDLTSAFLSKLEEAQSNDEEEGTGRQIYEKRVLSAKPEPPL